MPRSSKKDVGGLDDLLLAVMMREGTISVHDLYSKLGLSQGSTTRSLERLKHYGLAKGETGEDARKTAFEITEEGVDRVRQGWRNAVTFSLQSSMPEEIFRGVILAMLMDGGAEVKESIPKLKDLAATRRVHAREIIASAEQKLGPISYYHGLFRAVYEAGRMRGESEALDEIAYRLEQIVSDPWHG